MIEATFAAVHEFLLPFVVCLGVTLVLAVTIRRFRPHWGTVRISFWASAPLPLLALLLCAYVFISAAVSSPERCGVDACGMAMGFSMIIGIWFVVIFAVTASLCYAVLRLLGRHR